MAYYINKANQQVRIDKGGNMFIGKKCVNTKQYFSAASNFKIVEQAVEDGQLTEGLYAEITGHVPNFEYGHTRDESGNPVCKTLFSPYKAW